NYGNAAEIQITSNSDAQEILKNAMHSATIRKFEIKEPSLNDIFIESVRATNTGGAE
ncbi:MAG: DUF4162 domain-containing protein, partial [Candidatus Aminicenantes bacterium]